MFLNAIHLSEEIKHPWSSLGAKDSTGSLQDNTSRLTVSLVTLVLKDFPGLEA